MIEVVQVPHRKNVTRNISASYLLLDKGLKKTNQKPKNNHPAKQKKPSKQQNPTNKQPHST